MKIRVERYQKNGWNTRYWAVYIGDQLLAVVLYKKGATAIVDALRPGAN